LAAMVVGDGVTSVQCLEHCRYSVAVDGGEAMAVKASLVDDQLTVVLGGW
jgi:hypothetical protein